MSAERDFLARGYVCTLADVARDDLPDEAPVNVSDVPFRPRRIISGGQTGVDRGALDAAMELGIAHGGWCPRGRLAEDGRIPGHYQMCELDSPDYSDRTERNVIDSDATLVLYETRISGGTLLTRRIAQQLGKPCLAARLDRGLDLLKVRDWLERFRPETLNVAGPRASSAPGIQQRARSAVLRVLDDPQRRLDL